jgi:hypothetical protein
MMMARRSCQFGGDKARTGLGPGDAHRIAGSEPWAARLRGVRLPRDEGGAGRQRDPIFRERPQMSGDIKRGLI